ncbi:single-strand DNA endonuclease ASTE1-like [Xenentodon cancila]
MGVQGLSTLLETNGRIYRDVRFRGSRLVIDGNNLTYLLYFKSGLNQNYGGEYASFEDLIERFISALRTCKVMPYVILDGGTDITDRKLETLTKRGQRCIQNANQAARTGAQKGILPQLAKKVFKQTLIRLQVPLAQCFGEADQEIAALAAEWKCPVLSNDGDFFVFHLPAGFLPITHFRWEDVKTDSNSYIPCKSYNTSSFCIFFQIQHQLLPTFAALAGNDYVKLKKVDWTQFAPVGSKTPSRLEGLLCWLRDFQQPQEAMEAALGLMGELDAKRKEEVLKELYEGMKEYQPHQSSLQRFFIHGVAPPFQGYSLVPDWTRLALTQARLTADVLDVLQLRRMSLGFAVEPQHSPSMNVTSRPIREVMYGLLLGRGASLQVEERDRVGLQLVYVPVRPAFSKITEQLKLSSLHEAELSERLPVLLEALGVTEDTLSLLPAQLKLPVAVTCFWLQRAEPPPDLLLVKALLLGMSIEDKSRHKAGKR